MPLRPPHTVRSNSALTMKEPAEGEQPLVESWIARELRKRGKTEFRAVTAWVRLAEEGEEITHVWNAMVDGKGWGCPVVGRVIKRTTGGRVTVSLTGWAPVLLKVKGTTLSAETGSRRIAVVDHGKAYAALFVGPQRPISQGEWTYKNGKPESVTFVYGTALTAKEIDQLSSYTSLTRIVMGYAGVDSEFVEIEGDLWKLGRLKNLEEVHLCIDAMNDDHLRFIALLPKIQTLEFNADNGYDEYTRYRFARISVPIIFAQRRRFEAW